MRKLFCLLGILCICAVFPLDGGAAPGDAEVFTPNHLSSFGMQERGGMRQVAGLDGRLYAYMLDATIFTWQPGDDAPRFYCELPLNTGDATQNQAEVDLIAAGDGALWGVDIDAGRIGRIDEGGVAWLDKRFDPERLTFDVDAPRIIEHALVQDGKLYVFVLLYNGWDANRNTYELLGIDLASGAVAALETPGAQGICSYTPGFLLLLRAAQEDGMVLSTYDIASGVLTDLPYALPVLKENGTIGGMAYDASLDRILFTAQNQVWASQSDAQFAVVAYVPVRLATARNQGCILPGGLYAVSDNGCYIRNTDQVQTKAPALHIQAGYLPAPIQKDFVKENPDIPVVEITALANAEAIAKEVTTGSSAVDIYQIELDHAFRALAEKGYVADLSASEIIAADFMNMSSVAQAALSNSDGKPVAYPVNIFLYEMGINMGFWKLAFGDAPAPKTYTTFLDAWLQWEEEIAEEYPEIDFVENFDHAYWTRQIIEAYVQQYEVAGMPLDFQSPVLHDALVQLEAVREARENKNRNVDFLGMDEWGERRGIFTITFPEPLRNDDNPELAFRSMFIYDIDPDATQTCPLVFEAGRSPTVRAGVMLWVANPNSQNLEWALRFIEYATRQRNNPQIYYAMHPNASDPLEVADFQARVASMEERRSDYQSRLEESEGDARLDIEDGIKYIDNWLANRETVRWEISERSIAQYRALEPSIRFFENSLYLGSAGNGIQIQIQNLCSRYAQRQLNLDAFLNELNNKMQMVYTENML